jgi:hypothetical protein
MKKFLQMLYDFLLLSIFFIGLPTIPVHAQQYTGHGVPVDTITGLPATTYPIISDGVVFCSVPDGSGGWFIGGSFTTVGGQPRNGLAHILANGSLDMGWVANVTGTAVYAMDYVPGVGLVVGGSFSEINGTGRNSIAALGTSNGGVLSWYPSGGLNGIVYAVTSRQFGGATIVGGNFTYGALSNLVDINSTASFVQTMGNPNNTVMALAIMPAGANQYCYVGGDFTQIFGTEANRIVRIYRDFEMGWNWEGWYPTGGADGTVRSFSLAGEGSPWEFSVIAGGDFTTIGGVARHRLAALSFFDATVESWNPDITGSSVYAVASTGPLIYAGGDFSHVGVTARNNLAAVSTATGIPTDWAPSPDDVVRTLTIPTTYIYVGGYFDSMNVIIPVELTNFTANLNENSVELNWVTASETNNHGFEIQRSSGGEFETLAFINGHGTTTETHVYNYTDRNLNDGDYNYRLKQIDFNGAFEYSKTIKVEINIPLEFSLDQNYPNPFNPTTMIRFTLPQDGWVSLKFHNILGQEVNTLYEGEIGKGYHSFLWSGQDMAGQDVTSGIYFYSITVRNNSSSNSSLFYSRTKKMILLR